MEKNEIIQKATELYKKYGLKSVTMDDVARECMISKKTLYKYVNDKVDLITQAFRNEFEIQTKRFASISEKKLNAVEEILEIRKNIISMIKTYKPALEYDMYKYYPVIHRELIEKKSKFIYQVKIKNLTKGINEGLFYDDIDIDLIAKRMVILETQKIENSVVSYKEFLKPKATKEMFKYHLRAICNSNGLKILNKKIKELN